MQIVPLPLTTIAPPLDDPPLPGGFDIVLYIINAYFRQESQGYTEPGEKKYPVHRRGIDAD